MEKVYIESSVISCKVSLPSLEYDHFQMQIQTKRFWEYAIKNLDIFISAAFIDEIRKGNVEAVKRREKIISEFRMLPVTTEVLKLAAIYIKELRLPRKSEADAVHMALACINGMDYLVTLNCKHIANVHNMRKILTYNSRHKIPNVIITTPDLFMGRKNDE